MYLKFQRNTDFWLAAQKSRITVSTFNPTLKSMLYYMLSTDAPNIHLQK